MKTMLVHLRRKPCILIKDGEMYRVQPDQDVPEHGHMIHIGPVPKKLLKKLAAL